MMWWAEGLGAMPTPAEAGVEEVIVTSVLWLKLAVETIGALIILAGVAIAAVEFVRAAVGRAPDGYNGVRLTLARFLALALEFQLGADILSTAVAPSWDQIGKLGAIAVIRTALNYFLMREMREARGGPPGAGPRPGTAMIGRPAGGPDGPDGGQP